MRPGRAKRPQGGATSDRLHAKTRNAEKRLSGAHMGFRNEIITARWVVGLIGAMLVAPVAISSALAGDLPVSPMVQEAAGWYFSGGLETGGRYVFDRPPSGYGTTPASSGGLCSVGGGSAVTQCFLTASQTQSRAKFEEYGSVPNGLFLDWINLQGGTKDGRYAYDFWGRSVGLNNQGYELNVAKIGEFYLSVGWDQTPHLMSTSAKTVFSGVGTTSLTVDPTLRANLAPLTADPNTGDPVLGAANRDAMQAFINNAEKSIVLSTQRDKASIAGRYTPNADWDFSAQYEHEHRTGVRAAGLAYFGDAVSTAHYPIEVPQPIDDTTQNAEAKGEYVGTGPWGKWSSNVVYNGSIYHNNLKQLDVQNPLCDSINCDVLTGGTGANPFFAPNTLRMGLDPSNNANAVTWNGALDLPFWKARYVSTVQYNAMRQNDPFVDTGTNGLVAPPVTLNGVPVGSLNGQVNTTLWNNIVTMSPTKDLKVTLRGRHYDVDNNTPSLHVDDWITIDSTCSSGNVNLNGTCGGGAARNSLPISYIKDNASADMSWKAASWATVGGGYYWERWDRKLRDVNVTNENTLKAFVDLTPNEIAHGRISYQYGERRYGTYDIAQFVETPGLMSDQFASNLRRFDVANRNRQKVDAQMDFALNSSLTISPNAGLRWDDYPDQVFNLQGVSSDHSWNAGVELGAALGPQVKLMAAYNYEDRRLVQASGNGDSNGVACPSPLDNTANTPECTWRNNSVQRYHTFLLASDWKVVPEKFDLRLEGLYTMATEANQFTPCTASVPGACDGFGTNPFPDSRANLIRFNAVAKYYVDPDLVQRLGLTGAVIVKARYTWERNSVDNWAINNMTPYVATPDGQLEGGNRALFLAATNPNYTAQTVALSVAVHW
jgi:MtrB/PioB family decaheme-associated outer membrane protein